MTRYPGVFWDSDRLSPEARGRIAQIEPDQPPEPGRSQALRLNTECLDRVRAAICRPSGPGAVEAAKREIRRRGGGRVGARALQPVREREGAA